MEDNYVKVILEDISSKIKVIVENTTDLPSRMGNIETDVAQIKEDIAVIKSSVKNKANIDRVEKTEADVKVLQQKIA